ncbi:hypothetical protein [Oryzibacter oryziterrae]|uniref:hypothetical protein n=1 Tax=Oryzibacter oryziterrae TaxID=2766474 RepID=UPI001F1F934B|nr:hypothetical protein [Oryzibacter oryziterrae]
MSGQKFPIEEGPSYVNPTHPRAAGYWKQYEGLSTRLSGRIYLSDILDANTGWENFKGEPVEPVDLAKQTPENYHDTHNHYQLLMSEVSNFLPGANAVPIWGDGAAIQNGSAAWGAFFSARSDYLIGSGSVVEALVPEGTNRDCAREDYDCSLTGIEVDVINAGKPGVFPNKAKHGITVVGFGNPNSHALSIICENFDCAPDLRRGQFEAGIYLQNSLHPVYGRLIVSDMEKAHIGLDFRTTVFDWGAIQIKGAGQGTGIVFNSGAGGEIYTGQRWGGQGEPCAEWLTIRLPEVGLRIVSADSTHEILTIEAPPASEEQGEDAPRHRILVDGQDIIAELDRTRRELAELHERVSALESLRQRLADLLGQ